MESNGQPYSEVILSWTPATNQVSGTPFQIWYGSVSHSYSGHWYSFTNQFTITAGMLQPGITCVAVSQISTNAAGTLTDVSGFSGEVQLQEIPMGVVTPGVTNLEVMASTDLGQSWSTTGTNLVMVPYSEKAQQFFRARGTMTISITTTNVMQILGGPN